MSQKIRVINEETGKFEYLTYEELMEFRGFGTRQPQNQSASDAGILIPSEVITPSKNKNNVNHLPAREENSVHSALRAAFAQNLFATKVNKSNTLSQKKKQKPFISQPTSGTMHEPG